MLRELHEIVGKWHTDLLGQRYMRYTYVGLKNRPVRRSRSLVAA